MRSAECGLWNINNETRHLVSYPDLVGTIALRCPRWRSPLIGQRNGELSGGGRESAGQRTAQRARPYLGGSLRAGNLFRHAWSLGNAEPAAKFVLPPAVPGLKSLWNTAKANKTAMPAGPAHGGSRLDGVLPQLGSGENRKQRSKVRSWKTGGCRWSNIANFEVFRLIRSFSAGFNGFGVSQNHFASSQTQVVISQTQFVDSQNQEVT
jgi:hypothetical protein